jgi:hypothetical protein
LSLDEDVVRDAVPGVMDSDKQHQSLDRIDAEQSRALLGESQSHRRSVCELADEQREYRRFVLHTKCPNEESVHC